MTRLEQRIRDQILNSGPIPFAGYMSLALYDARGGYYARDERTGWKGDFITSPELDPTFGALWARAFEQVWEASGRPQSFEVIEAGPGEGSFAAAVIEAAPDPFARALTYRLIERMAPARARQEERLAGFEQVTWSAALTEVAPIEAGCLFANEVLDNLPVHLAERRDGELLEVFVGAADDSLVEVLQPPSTPEMIAYLERYGIEVGDGERVEVPLAAASFCTRAAGVLGSGAIILVDYGGAAPALAMRPRGTLVCYSPAGADDAPLERPGEKDITAHANWSVVEDSLGDAGWTVVEPRPQIEILTKLGIRDVDVGLRDEHDKALAEKKGTDAVRALSRRHALRALLDPSGLGGLDVVVATKGVPVPEFARK